LSQQHVSSRSVLEATILLTAILLGASTLLIPSGRAASPSSGTITDTSTSTSWTGQFYAASSVALPDQCPPSIDPFNLICDHFFLTLNLPGGATFWQTHVGSVVITIQWTSSDNDFDLYIYRQSDGQQVASSASGGTVSEQVALQSPLPGTYEVRVVPFLVTLSDYAGTAQLFSVNQPPTQNPTFPTGGLAFSPATIVDPQRTEGEPLNHIDKYGNIWETGPWGFSTAQGFVARSTDNGDSFHIVSPNGLRPNPAASGGGDTDIITDDQGFTYFADLEALADVGVAVSNDGGNNWRENSLSVLPGADRQWLAIDNGPTNSASDNTVFLAFNQQVFGWQILSSPGSTGFTDPTGGFLYTNAAGSPTAAVTTDDRCGRLLFDPFNRMVYLPCNNGDHVDIWKAHVDPGQRTGLQFSLGTTPASPGGQIGLGRLFSDVAVDTAGNIYAVWVDIRNNNVYYSASPSAGANTGSTYSWTTPVQINGDPANSNVMPWAVAGSAGILDIAFYGTDIRGDPNTFPSWYNNRIAATTVKWYTYLVQVRNAITNTPTINQVKASEHPTDYGQICTGGLGCTTSGGDRTLADFFTLAIDANGAARIVINDLTNQHHGASLFQLTQTAGPSALGTTLTPSTSNTATGVTDPSGDAQVLHYSPAGAGANQPALDLVSLQLSQPNQAHLTVTLTLQSLSSLLPPPGTTGLLWLTRWQFLSTGDTGEESYRIFYLGANSTAGQSPVFFAGTGTSATPTGVMGNGCITNTPQNCKVILYPNEISETGSINAAKNTITITAPLTDIGNPIRGDILYSVTALTFAFTTPNKILTDADATRVFDYVLGKGPQPTCPQGSTCRVTGGGYIFVDQQQDHGTFTIEVTVDPTGRIHGKAAYNDPAAGLDFRTILITSATFNRNAATISGNGAANNVSTNFSIGVQDNAEPGAGQDTFSINLQTGYSKSGVLQGGNIQIH